MAPRRITPAKSWRPPKAAPKKLVIKQTVHVCPSCNYSWSYTKGTVGAVIPNCPSCGRALHPSTITKQVVSAWAGLDALEKCDGMPDMDNDYHAWRNEWCDNASPLPDQTHAIEIGSPVWMLVLDKGTDVVIDHPANYPRDTRYEWTFSGKLAWSDGHVVYVPFNDVIPYEDDPSMTIVGFFVPLSCLYIPESRKGKAARTGKQIEREVKLAKSTGKGEWTVLVYKDGTASCNCPSWIYHHDENGGCKHTKKVI